MNSSETNRLWVGSLLLVGGLLVRAGIEHFSPSMYWPDEIYQTLEPAHRLAFGYGSVMWEYSEGLRSWVFPGLLAGVMWVGQFFGDGSTGYLAATTLFLSFISLIPPAVTYLWARRKWGGGWLPVVAMLFPLLWFENIYFGPKSLFETFTIHLVAAAIFLVRFDDGRWLRAFCGGLVLGICVITRPHLAPVPIVLAAWIPMYARRPHASISALATGVVAGAGIAGFVDVVAHGVPFHSLIVNLHTNVIEGRASQWGTFPWWQYFAWAWDVSPVGSVAMGVALLTGLVRYPMLAGPALAILAAHCAIPHKEYRFAYPVVALSSMIVGLEATALAKYVGMKIRSRRAGLVTLSVLLACWCTASVVGGLNFRLGPDGQVHEDLNWTMAQDKLLAYRYLSRRDVCGMARVGIAQMETGGYSYLHHDVEIQHMPHPDAIPQDAPRFNAFVIDDFERENHAGFERKRCFGKTCVYMRPGDCN